MASTTSTRPTDPTELVGQIERLAELDEPASTVGKTVRDLIPAGPVKDALTGRWLGHAVHPVLTDLPIGTWTSAVLLDWLGGRPARDAADRLIALGLLAAGPAAVTGITDWADTEAADPAVRRIGLVHAVSNVAALGLFGASYALRRRGARAGGRLFALAGTATLASGGYLGGHLSFARGVAVDQTAFEDRTRSWTPVLRESDLPEGEARYAEVEGVGVMVARWEGAVHALSNRCAHRGGPLDEGELHDGCVTCPLHGSTFRLADGAAVRGPSPYPQPRWEVRLRGGVIELRAPAEG
jgi:nitrite reductase/ring-hydroxylating ferredoxin subunit